MAKERISRARWLLFGLIVAAWPVVVILMWRALWTVPDATVLQSPRMVPPPTMRTFWREAIVLAAEVAALCALVWPRARLYGVRLAGAAAALPVWFLATVPNGLTTVAQVHRRGLAALVVVLWVSVIVTLIARTTRPRAS